jgi:hypothetical protein
MAENENNKNKLGEIKPQTNKKINDTFDPKKPLGKQTPDNFSDFPIKQKEDLEKAEKLKNKPPREDS